MLRTVDAGWIPPEWCWVRIRCFCLLFFRLLLSMRMAVLTRPPLSCLLSSSLVPYPLGARSPCTCVEPSPAWLRLHGVPSNRFCSHVGARRLLVRGSVPYGHFPPRSVASRRQGEAVVGGKPGRLWSGVHRRRCNQARHVIRGSLSVRRSLL